MCCLALGAGSVCGWLMVLTSLARLRRWLGNHVYGINAALHVGIRSHPFRRGGSRLGVHAPSSGFRPQPSVRGPVRPTSSGRYERGPVPGPEQHPVRNPIFRSATKQLCPGRLGSIGVPPTCRTTAKYGSLNEPALRTRSSTRSRLVLLHIETRSRGVAYQSGRWPQVSRTERTECFGRWCSGASCMIQYSATH